MSKFRTKPMIIEAEPYQPGMEDGFAEEWPDHIVPYLNTPSGRQCIEPGAYIITLSPEDRYPCRAEVFNAKYEPVETFSLCGISFTVKATSREQSHE